MIRQVVVMQAELFDVCGISDLVEAAVDGYNVTGTFDAAVGKAVACASRTCWMLGRVTFPATMIKQRPVLTGTERFTFEGKGIDNIYKHALAACKCTGSTAST